MSLCSSATFAAAAWRASPSNATLIPIGSNGCDSVPSGAFVSDRRSLPSASRAGLLPPASFSSCPWQRTGSVEIDGWTAVREHLNPRFSQYRTYTRPLCSEGSAVLRTRLQRQGLAERRDTRIPPLPTAHVDLVE